MNLDTAYYEFLIGAGGIFLVLVIVQIIFARVRKKNLKSFDHWYEIYLKEENDDEFTEIYAINRPKKRRNPDEEFDKEQVNNYLKIKNRRLKMSKNDEKPSQQDTKGKEGPASSRETRMVQPHKK